MNTIDPALTAIIGAILGGSGLEIIRYWLNRPKEEVDIASQVRDELREDVIRLRAELVSVEAELDQWKVKYYQLLKEVLLGRIEIETALEKIRQNDEEKRRHP